MKALLALFFCGVVSAHEMTPAYPTFTPAHVDGVFKTEMQMFNRRSDVEYYEIGVFDADWKAVTFVSAYNIVNVKYLGHVKFDLYIREADLKKATYICSKSLLRRSNDTEPLVSSKICSKIKQ